MIRLLIIGGSHRDIPLIEVAKSMGYFVITIGGLHTYIGHKYANKSYVEDFNNLTRIKEIIKNEKISYFIPGSGEVPYMLCVKLSQQNKTGNFDTYHVAKLIHNKWQFKNFCLKHNLSTPYGIFYSDNIIPEELSYPVIIKPTNLSGGKGITTVNNIDEFYTAINEAKSISDEILIEDFIDGELIAYSVFIQKQKVYYEFCAKDVVLENEYAVTTAYPIQLKNKTLQLLRSDINIVAQELNIVDGMFHIQAIIKNDKAYIIDVTRRIPGDLFPYLIEFSHGVEYSKAIIKSYLGIQIEDELQPKTNKFIIRHVVKSNKNGSFKDIVIATSLKNKIVYQLICLQKGQYINNYLQDIVAILLIENNENDHNITKNLNQLIKVQLQ